MTKSTKPISSSGKKVSHPKYRETIQINNALEVSIVDLYAAEAYLVIATPVALNIAIETIIKIEQSKTSGWLPIS